MKAKVRKFRKEKELDTDGHYDEFLYPEMLRGDDIVEFEPIAYKNWYKAKDTRYNYHISWLIPVEENENS